MPNFKHYDYNQTSMVVINFAEQLQPGTFEHALHFLVAEKLDLSVFYPNYSNDQGKGGRPAYDPAILLQIILFAYSKGITSSREIEWSCRHNIIFKALSCDSEPHFTTIANFVSQHPNEIEAVFEQVLLICHQQGLLGNALFAIDGCKLPSNAAKEWSGTFAELERKRKKIRNQIRQRLADHQRLDKQQTRDDERIQRNQQAIETLSKAADKLDKHLKTAAPRMGKGRVQKEVKSNITDNESAKMTTSKGTIQGYTGIAAVDKNHQIIIDAQAFGEGQEQHTLQPVLEKIEERFQRLGISDTIYDDGVIVTANTGFASEQNMAYLHANEIDAYIPDNQFRSRDPRFQEQKQSHGKRHQDQRKGADIIPASEFVFDPVGQHCVCPAGNALWLKNETVDRHGNPKLYFEGRLTDCRHCAIKERCMRNPAAADNRHGRGRQVSFIIEARRKPTYTDWMRYRVDSDEGRYIYSHRMSIVEPVFGNITVNKKLKRFSLRGKCKVNGQWLLYCLVHNIEKIQNYGSM